MQTNYDNGTSDHDFFDNQQEMLEARSCHERRLTH